MWNNLILDTVRLYCTKGKREGRKSTEGGWVRDWVMSALFKSIYCKSLYKLEENNYFKTLRKKTLRLFFLSCMQYQEIPC